MTKILLTGGTGFIGSHILECFKENGEDIACISRKKADIRNFENLEASFKGADCVIHNAAMASDWGKYSDFYENNITGTMNVLKACSENNIQQLILTSSSAVFGEANCKSIKNEQSDENSHYNYFLDRIFPSAMNYYRDTKKAAKELAEKYAKEHNLNLTIIYPVWVYGEREFGTGFYEYLKTAKEKMPLIMGSKKNKLHLIYAKDLARAYLLAYRADLKGINDFLIGNSNAENMDMVYNLFCEYAGYKKPRNAPKLFMYPIGFFMELLYTVFSVKTPPLLTRARVNMFYDNVEFSIQKAKEKLGFECQYSLETGIKNTVEWYKKEGFL